jgi:hypothetical protein
MTAPTPQLTTTQLLLLRSLKRDGWPCDLLDHLLPRCGAGQAEWDALVAAGLVESHLGRWRLTDDGKREYKRQSAGRWF